MGSYSFVSIELRIDSLETLIKAEVSEDKETLFGGYLTDIIESSDLPIKIEEAQGALTATLNKAAAVLLRKLREDSDEESPCPNIYFEIEQALGGFDIQLSELGSLGLDFIAMDTGCADYGGQMMVAMHGEVAIVNLGHYGDPVVMGTFENGKFEVSSEEMAEANYAAQLEQEFRKHCPVPLPLAPFGSL